MLIVRGLRTVANWRNKVKELKELKEGFYHLISDAEPEPILVHGYHCSDMAGQFVLGFNAHDGGGILPFYDLTDDAKVIPVTVSEEKITVAQAMDVLKEAMIDVDPGSYAHSWHCNIAMMCHDAIHASGLTEFLSESAPHTIGNDAASRFMKLCFGAETKN